jgi:hypothetical protein
LEEKIQIANLVTSMLVFGEHRQSTISLRCSSATHWIPGAAAHQPQETSTLFKTRTHRKILRRKKKAVCLFITSTTRFPGSFHYAPFLTNTEHTPIRCGEDAYTAQNAAMHAALGSSPSFSLGEIERETNTSVILLKLCECGFGRGSAGGGLIDTIRTGDRYGNVQQCDHQ